MSDNANTETTETSTTEASDTSTNTEATETEQGSDASGEETASTTEGKPAEGEEGQTGEDSDGDSEHGQEGSVDASSISVPEGFQLNEGLMEKFLPMAQEKNMSQEEAQQMINMHVEGIQSALENPELRSEIYTEQHATRVDEWADRTFDGQFGDELKTKESLADAKSAIDALNIPELTALVDDAELGFGNHPKFVALFSKIGQQVKEHGFAISASSDVPIEDKSFGEVMYGNENK